MSNVGQNRINPCRPGFDASCALCCGSHNYPLPPEKIEDMFLNRGRGPLKYPVVHPDQACNEKLFQDAIQCPHVGMKSSFPGHICCLIYDDHSREKKIDSFFNGTCKTFYCPAWHDLTDEQVLFAARLMHDWYYYSLLINDIEAVHEICAAYGTPDDIPPDELRSLKIELVERLLEEDGK